MDKSKYVQPLPSDNADSIPEKVDGRKHGKKAAILNRQSVIIQRNGQMMSPNFVIPINPTAKPENVVVPLSESSSSSPTSSPDGEQSHAHGQNELSKKLVKPPAYYDPKLSDDEEAMKIPKPSPGIRKRTRTNRDPVDTQGESSPKRKKPLKKSETNTSTSTSFAGSSTPASNFLKRKLTESNSGETLAKTLKRDEAAPALKLSAQPPEEGNDAATRMMSKMGYKSGQGLGKNQQGIVEPIEAKSIVSRSGIGYSVAGLERGKQDWDFEADKIIIEEIVEWIPSPKTQPPNLEQMLAWRILGTQQLDISNAIDFCDADILKHVLTSKSTLDQMDGREFGRARFRSNPFETLGKGIFMNRAALKMANLDAVLKFELTNPLMSDGSRFSESNELFYFADVCAGPGGFSEYVLWKKGWDAKGFGFTLKGDCDFKLGDFVAGTSESFEAHYGVNDDGDIFNPANIQSFVKYVKDSTNGFGVHLMMADGGFSVDGQENIQEILSKQLYLSQIVVALAIVGNGGRFICKLFDIFTPFSVGLIYLLRNCFDNISIHKPNTSRPANSERYVLCKGKKREADVEDTVRYLLDCHTLMWTLSQDKQAAKQEIMELVPLSILLNDEDFYDYIYASNNELGLRQIQNLQKIVAFYRDPNLHERRQMETKINCLKFWNVPNERRRGFVASESPPSRFYELLRSDDGAFARREETDLTMSNMKSAFRSPCDWSAVIVESPKSRLKRGFYLGLGGTKIFRYNDSRWEAIDIKFELCKDTLIYGEIVNEIYDMRKPHTSRAVAFHIIDGMILGGKDVRYLNYWDRHKTCTQFAKAMNKPNIPTLAPIRVKEIVPMEQISIMLDGLREHAVGSKIYLPINLGDETSRKVAVGGLLFIKIVNDPWMIARSRREQQKLYYYNTHTKLSTYEPSTDVYADFKHTMNNRVVWWWDNYTNFGQTNPPAPGTNIANERVQVQPFLQFVQSIPTN